MSSTRRKDLTLLIIHVRAIIKPESREASLAAARDVIGHAEGMI